jgi:hypothetical protein
MGAVRKDPPYTIHVEAGPRDDGVWLIRATLRYRDGVPADGNPLLGEARLALLGAIAEAGQRGRARGADRCRVVMDTGDGVSEVNLGDVPYTSSLN